MVSTHSRPKAAAKAGTEMLCGTPFQHTAARRRLHEQMPLTIGRAMFQHTAARRRLPTTKETRNIIVVSTHSRAEAAAIY